MKKANSISKTKTDRFKEAIKNSPKKHGRHISNKEEGKHLAKEGESHNFIKGDKGGEVNQDNFSYGVQTLESLKKMLIDATKERILGGELADGLDILKDLEDQNNAETILKYLTDSKNSKLPVQFRKRLDNGHLLASRLRSQSNQEKDLENYDFQGEDDYEDVDYSQVDDLSPLKQSRDTDSFLHSHFNKPLLNSKKQLSSLLIQGSHSSHGQYKDFQIETRNKDLTNDGSILKLKKLEERKDNLRVSSPDGKVKYDPPLPKKNIKLSKKYKERVRETDPVLSKSKLFLIEKKSFKEFQRVRDTTSNKKRKKTLQPNSKNLSYSENIHDDKLPHNLSPIHKLLYQDTRSKFRENYLHDMPLMSNNLSSNLVLEGSTSNRWKFLYKSPDFLHKYALSRDYNYSNNEFLQSKRKNRRTINSKDQLIKDRLMNFSTENGAAAGHEFFFDARMEDNLSEDIHSFIDKHMKVRRNIKDSYLYDEQSQKLAKKSYNKSESRRNQLVKAEEDYSNPSNSFISVNGNRYESTEKLVNRSPVKSHNMVLQTLKLSKTRSTELADSGKINYHTKRLNRENPYKMSFSNGKKM